MLVQWVTRYLGFIAWISQVRSSSSPDAATKNCTSRNRSQRCQPCGPVSRISKQWLMHNHCTALLYQPCG